MTTRRRLGAGAAVALGAALLVAVLVAPALAWGSSVSLEQLSCLGGQERVHYRIQAFEPGHTATVHVSYSLNGGPEVKLPDGAFGQGQFPNIVAGIFKLPGDTTGTVKVTAKVDWENGQHSSDWATLTLKACETPSSSTTTTTGVPATTATTTPTGGSLPGSSVATTSAQGQLPFTGASTTPLLVAGIGLLGGGLLVLLASRRGTGRQAR